MSSTIKCQECGTPLNPSAHFCHLCGTPISDTDRTEDLPRQTTTAKRRRFSLGLILIVLLLLGLGVVAWVLRPTGGTATTALVVFSNTPTSAAIASRTPTALQPTATATSIVPKPTATPASTSTTTPAPTTTPLPSATATAIPPSPTLPATPTVEPTPAAPEVTNDVLIGSGVQIQQQDGGTGLRIVMLGPDSQPWEDVYFEIYKQQPDVSGNPTRGERMRDGRINQQGLIDFELDVGTYAVCPGTTPGYSWTTRDCIYNVQVAIGQLTTVTLQVGQIEVALVGATGEPWENVYFQIFTQKQDVSGNQVVDTRIVDGRTDNTGIRGSWLTPGLYAVAVDLRGYTWGDLRGTKGESNVVLEKGKTNRILIKMGRLTIGLKKPNGDPNTDVYVEVYTQRFATNGQPVLDERVWDGRTDNGGFATIDLTQGQYAVKIGDTTQWNIPVEWGQVTTSDGKTAAQQ